MAGVTSPAMAVAVSEAGDLGSIAGAMLTPEALRGELQIARQGTSRPINANFFVHRAPDADAAREAAWRQRLAPYYRELGLAADAGAGGPARAPFNAVLCDVVLEFKPRVVSFHFGLPEGGLMKRLKEAKIVVISSATTVAEACWLEAHGVDAVIAQGAEAGGHRGMFLVDDIARQAGTMALVPQVVDAVKVPVIAAGGIGDGRGIAAALALGAAGVQMGTAFMLTPEAKTGALHRAALKQADDNSTTLTNLFTGRPGARHRQPLHQGSRSDERRGAAISPGGGRGPAAGGCGRGEGLNRLHAVLERPGAVAGAREAGGAVIAADGRDRGGAQPRAGMTASRSWSTKPRVIGAWPISRR